VGLARTKEKQSVPESIVIDIPNERPFPEAVQVLSKYGFYFSVSVYLYAILFPFHFDLSWRHLLEAWSQAILTPFWDAKRGLHLSGDDVANFLFTMPFGFFGFLHFAGKNKGNSTWQWGLWGIALGLGAEFLQLAIPTRASVLTDAVNSGLGASMGAFFASVKGISVLEFFTGAASERRNIYLWLLIWSVVAMVGPYDISQDFFTDIGTGTPAPGSHLQGSGTFSSGGWLQLAGFALIGALAARIAVPGRRKRTLGQPLAAIALVILFPVVLQFTRLLVESHAPVLDDLAFDIFGALAGAFISLLISPAFQAFSGFLLFKAALIVSGLSPFSFTTGRQSQVFQWIPFYEFCSSRTPAALYETILGFFSFAVLGGLLQLSFARFRPRYVALYALVFAAAIEVAQTFLPSRSAGITDIILAGLGAWTGAHICAAVETARLNQKIFARRAN
jgi:glycopeptide antibiotics resistance protein